MPKRSVLLAATLAIAFLAGVVPAKAVGPDGYITRREALSRSSVRTPAGHYWTQYPGNPNNHRLPKEPTTWDLRDWWSTNYDAFATKGSSFPLIFGGGSLQVTAPKPVTIGGRVLGQNPRFWTWDNWYARDFGANCKYSGECPNPKSAGAAEFMVPTGDGYGVSYDFTAEDVFDFFKVRPHGARHRPRFKVAGCEGTNVRDDAIENDWLLDGTVKDCLFDGVFQGVSLGQNSSGNRHAVLRIEDSVFVFRDMLHDDVDNDHWYVQENDWCRDLDRPWVPSSTLCPHGYPDPRREDGRAHGRMFKMVNDSLALYQFGKVVMHNVTICYEETPVANSSLADDLSWPANGSVYDHVTVVLSKQRPTVGRAGYDGDRDGDFTDLDLQPNPGRAVPTGITQTRDWGVCSAAIAGWHAVHPGR